MYWKFIANILLHVGFISALIGTFFFTYGAYIEQKVVKRQIADIVTNFTSEIQLIEPNILKQLAPLINNLKVPDSSVQDAQIDASNLFLIKEAAMVLGILLIICLVSAYFISKKYNFEFMDLIKENLIIVFFVFLTEFSFLTFIGQYYRSADPNFVKLQIVNVLQSYAS